MVVGVHILVRQVAFRGALELVFSPLLDRDWALLRVDHDAPKRTEPVQAVFDRAGCLVALLHLPRAEGIESLYRLRLRAVGGDYRVSQTAPLYLRVDRLLELAVRDPLVRDVEYLLLRVEAAGHQGAGVVLEAEVEAVADGSRVKQFLFARRPALNAPEHLRAGAGDFAEVFVPEGPLVDLQKCVRVAEEVLGQPLRPVLRRVEEGAVVDAPALDILVRPLVDPLALRRRRVVGAEGEMLAPAALNGLLDRANLIHPLVLGQFLEPEVLEPAERGLDRLLLFLRVEATEKNLLAGRQVDRLAARFREVPQAAVAQHFRDHPLHRLENRVVKIDAVLAVDDGVGQVTLPVLLSGALRPRRLVRVEHHQRHNRERDEGRLERRTTALEPEVAVAAENDVSPRTPIGRDEDLVFVDLRLHDGGDLTGVFLRQCRRLVKQFRSHPDLLRFPLT